MPARAPFQFLYRVKQGEYVPNGVVVDANARKTSGELVSAAALRVLFVGRLVPDKNPERLLMALAAATEFPWELTVCGRGPEEARLRELSRTLGIESRVAWLGFRDDVAQIMAAHDVLVLPSWREGSPNVALEAMAIGLPCILSRIPGNVALFAGPASALLVDPASTDELVAALRRLRNDAALRADLVTRAAAQVSQFRPEETARSYATFFRRLVSAA